MPPSTPKQHTHPVCTGRGGQAWNHVHLWLSWPGEDSFDEKDPHLCHFCRHILTDYRLQFEPVAAPGRRSLLRKPAAGLESAPGKEMLNAESGCTEGSSHPESEDGHSGQRRRKAHPTRTAHGHRFPPGVRVGEPGAPILTPTLKLLVPGSCRRERGCCFLGHTELRCHWQHRQHSGEQKGLLGSRSRAGALAEGRWGLKGAAPVLEAAPQPWRLTPSETADPHSTR